jgi:UDP-glucuronate decarboxylase
MRYLVTGGAGFLGSHLTERLLKNDHDVVVVDNLSSSDGSNLKYLCDYPNFQYAHLDVTTTDLVEIFEGVELDGIFNLACPASPPFYQNMPIETTLTCVVGATNVLELATQKNCKVLQASTSEVYGDPEISPQPETYRGRVNCFGPRACYDEGKRAAEALFFDYQKQRGVDIRIVRIFNTYGPRMLANDGRVVSNFIVQALKGEPITIYGSGEQTRSFCYVDDLLDAISKVWHSDCREPVNIGNPGEFTMLELAEKVIAITGSKSEISFMDLPADDPKQRKPNIAKAITLGWQGPQVPLDKGLESTIQYFMSELNSGRI